MKRCNGCKAYKNYDEFHSNGMGGIRGTCKTCISKRTKKNFTSIECYTCNNSFMPIIVFQKFCCRRCSQVEQVKRRTNKPEFKVCKLCNNKYKPYTTLDKFCSANCRVENQKSKRKGNRKWTPQQVARRKGKGNPSYKHGNRVIGKVVSNKSQRAFMKVRDTMREEMKEEHGYLFCERCKINRSYQWEMHHIVFRSEKPNHQYLHHPSNLINLCVKCHNHYHIKKSNRNELVEQRGLKERFGNLY